MSDFFSDMPSTKPLQIWLPMYTFLIREFRQLFCSIGTKTFGKMHFINLSQIWSIFCVSGSINRFLNDRSFGTFSAVQRSFSHLVQTGVMMQYYKSTTKLNVIHPFITLHEFWKWDDIYRKWGSGMIHSELKTSLWSCLRLLMKLGVALAHHWVIPVTKDQK